MGGGRQSADGDRLPDLDRVRSARGADDVRTQPGLGELSEPERNLVGAVDALEKNDSVRLNRGLCEPEWMAPARTGERGKLPPVVVDEDSGRGGIMRLGSRKLQTDSQRQSSGGSRLCGGSGKIHDAAICAGGSARRTEWCCRSPRYVSRRPGRIDRRPFENSAGRSFEGMPVDRKCAEVPTGREFRDYRLSDRTAECPVTVCTSRAGSGALPADEELPGSHGMRHRWFQADQRFFRAPGRRQTSAGIQREVERGLSRVRLRGAHGWR